MPFTYRRVNDGRIPAGEFARPLAIGVSDLVVGCFSIESLISVGSRGIGFPTDPDFTLLETSLTPP